MAISRRWWEPEAQDNRHDIERPARHSFDVGDLTSLAMSGGEFASQFAELLSCANHDRQPTGHLFLQRDAPAPSKEILG